MIERILSDEVIVYMCLGGFWLALQILLAGIVCENKEMAKFGGKSALITGFLFMFSLPLVL